MFITGKWD